MAALRSKKLTKQQIVKVNLSEFGDAVSSDDRVTHLRITGTLLLGLVVIYRRKTDYLAAELKNAMSRAKLSADVNFANIDLAPPVSARKTRNVIPSPDSSLIALLDQAYYTESLYLDEQFNDRLKSLLEEGLEEQLGFGVEFSYGGTPPDQLEALPPLPTPRAPDAARVLLPSQSRTQLVDDDVIDFGDGEEIEIEEGGGGDELIFEDYAEKADKLSKEIDEMNAILARKASRKRKRHPIDYPTQLSNKTMRENIDDTSDIVRPLRRPTRSLLLPRTGPSVPIDPDALWKEPQAFAVSGREPPSDYRAYYLKCVQPPKKRRKTGIDDEERSPELPRSKTDGEQQQDGDIFDFEEGGGGDEILYEDDDAAKPFSSLKKKPKMTAEMKRRGEKFLEDDESSMNAFERHLKGGGLDLSMRPSTVERTAWAFFQFLKKRFDEELEKPLSLRRVLNTTDRRVAAQGFHHTLVLASDGVLKVTQEKPYSKIWLREGEKWNSFDQ